MVSTNIVRIDEEICKVESGGKCEDSAPYDGNEKAIKRVPDWCAGRERGDPERGDYTKNENRRGREQKTSSLRGRTEDTGKGHRLRPIDLFG
jgi:hypothetical protein